MGEARARARERLRTNLRARASAIERARERARAGKGATYIEVYTYRAGAHSSSDDPTRYRPGDEFKCWPGGDPVDRLKKHLIKIGAWSEEKDTQLKEKIDSEVMAAYKEACTFGDLANGPFPPASTIFTEVYEEVPWHVQEQREPLPERHSIPSWND